MAEENKVAGECQYFYLGFTDSLLENSFVSVLTSQPMVGHTWAPNQPNNFDNQDCALAKKDKGLVYDMSCSFKACPLCQVNTMTTFQLSGICQGITMDRYFLLQEVLLLVLVLQNFVKFNPQDRKFIGYLMSSLAWSELHERWEILDLRNDQVIATNAGSKEYPLGSHQWQFENKSCHDPQSNSSRTLKFHLAVEEPGMFCCSDGLCFHSELVCDNVEHCADGADEQHCHLVHAKDKAYNPSIPPFGFGLENDVKVAKPLIINASVEIFEILHVDESVAKFSLLFRYHS